MPYTILEKRRPAENVVEYVIDAPAVCKNAKPGQFVVLRTDENGERVPFTICSAEGNRLTILVQEVGYTTRKMAQIPVGGSLDCVVGPLGMPTRLIGGRQCLVGGGIGTAVIYPQARRLYGEGRPADVIIGARNKSLILYEKELAAVAKNLYIVTDDGGYVRKGFVTDVLAERLEEGAYDGVFAVGPMPMMRAVCRLTAGRIKTVVSMNCIMLDGTGMCGCCRLTVGGETKYACVDGPEFDGHLVDWEEAVNRLGVYKDIEAEHICRLTNQKIKL
jgi:ferredoxin--NADP+ reductase